jgi:formate hydrogenlyase subunit 6/NADH:ubiquinone oxidoreductase subunit I
MICPVSAITMSNVWDTAVIDRLSRDTMSAREIKRRPKKRETQELNSEATTTPPAADEIRPTNE